MPRKPKPTSEPRSPAGAKENRGTTAERKVREDVLAAFKARGEELSGTSITARNEQRVAILREAMAAAEAMGKKIALSDVERMFEVSRPTAIKLRRAVEGTRTMAVMAVVEKLPDQLDDDGERRPPPRISKQSAAQILVAGINMTEQLADSAGKLKELAGDIRMDLKHARYFVLGCPPGDDYPGLCARCGAKEVGQLKVTNQPRLLQIGYMDLAKLLAEAVKTEKALTDIVSTYNDVLSQCYSFQSLEKFIGDVRQAITNVCPEYTKAFAAEIRRLQTLSGGMHG